MNKYYFFMVLIFILSLKMCSKEKTKIYETYKITQEVNNFPENETWELESLNNNEYLLPPEIFMINGEFIFTVNMSNDSLIEVFNANTGECVKVFGKKGKGPGEYLNITDIFSNSKIDNKFYIYENTKTSVDCYDISCIFNDNKSCVPEKTIKISMDAGKPIKFSKLNDSVFVSNGLFFNDLINYYGNDGSLIKNGKNFFVKIEGFSKNVYYDNFYHTDICINENKKLFSTANFNYDIFYIYNFKGEIKYAIYGPDFITPKLFQRGNKNDKSFSYFGLASTENYIFCSYSGVTIPSKSKNWLNMMPKNILIYNWEGKPYKRINFNSKIGKICVSEKLKKVFIVYRDGNFFKIGYHDIL